VNINPVSKRAKINHNMEPQIEKANEAASMVESNAAAATAALKENTESPSGLLIGKNVSICHDYRDQYEHGIIYLISSVSFLYIVRTFSLAVEVLQTDTMGTKSTVT
jgi:hypothetical protein